MSMVRGQLVSIIGADGAILGICADGGHEQAGFAEYRSLRSKPGER